MTAENIGNYRLLNCMMSGQTSQVWEVVEHASHRHFAMKLLLPEKAGDGEARRLLFHEANVGKKLAHPNIIRITDLSKDPKVPYFVMEFFPAGSLKLRLARKDLAFIKERAHSIFKQAATGFAYMSSSGWVHRDIKPDNMLVSAAGELRIIDLALCQRIQSDSLFSRLFRRRGKAQGTRSYMSPEQIRCEPLHQRADIYSFGDLLRAGLRPASVSRRNRAGPVAKANRRKARQSAALQSGCHQRVGRTDSQDARQEKTGPPPRLP